MVRVVRWIAVLALLALCATAAAQQEDPASVYQRVTIYNVNDPDVIDAEPLLPSMSRIDARREARQASLIRLRETFAEKVVASPGKL
jgi:predicted outer membrane protein